MRAGELLALRWKDIQLLDAPASPPRTRQSRSTTPKTRAAKRRIELGPRTIELLAHH